MNILVAVDGSKYSEKAVGFAAKLASESKFTLTILHVTPIISSTKGDLVQLVKEEIGSPEKAGKEYLRKGKEIAKWFNVEAKTKLKEGSPLEEILRECEKGGYDFIVVASHGKGKIDELLLGSVSLSLVHRSKCPILVVR